MSNIVSRSKHDPDRLHAKGWHALPTAITCVGLSLGFYAILLSIEANYQQAAVALFLAMIADKLDGLVARKTGAYTAFTVQMDSLSDVISFGAAPALLVYQVALQDAGLFGVLAAIFYTACTAFRLARFNVMSATADLRYFTGLPCPAAAAVIAALVWVSVTHQMDAKAFAPAMALLILLGLAMVSSTQYLSFKTMPNIRALVITAAFVFLSLTFWGLPATLLGGFTLYALSGPLLTFARRQR